MWNICFSILQHNASYQTSGLVSTLKLQNIMWLLVENKNGQNFSGYSFWSLNSFVIDNKTLSYRFDLFSTSINWKPLM